MGLVNCRPASLEPQTWPPWNNKAEDLRRQIGDFEVTQAVPWKTLTREQQDFQATKMAIHAAMVYRMDRELGRVLDQLRAMNTLDDTLILFLSDNGASAEQMIRSDGHDSSAAPGSWRSHLCIGPGWSSAANSPFRLHKSWVHEGGISSPLIAHWPAGIRDRGKVRHTPCHLVDVLPTLVDVAGGTPPVAGSGAPPLPGRSFAPAFAQDRRIDREFIFFHHLDNRALRVGDWKLVSAGKDGPWELYDLSKDRGETTDLAAKDPERTRDMASRWERLEAEFLAQQKRTGG
jgi:arylsulfatase